MALNFPAGIPLSYETNKKVTPRILIAKFGASYEQRAQDGIHTKPRTGTIKIDQTRSILDQVNHFLESTQGSTSFWFTPPYDTPGTFVADTGWTVTEKGYDYAIMEIPIREVFELAQLPTT